MRLTDEMKMEFIDIKARLESIDDGDYLDRSYGGLEELDAKFRKQYLNDVITDVLPMHYHRDDDKIFMGPLQIQEKGY